jgi:hypothetical protein
MIITPAKVDAYLKAKGIEPRMSDAAWTSAIRALSPFFKDGRAFQVKLLHQREDSLRRFSSAFPDSVPSPYRFVDYIQFVAGGATPDEGILITLKRNSIPFITTQQTNGPDEEDVVTIIRVGPS